MKKYPLIKFSLIFICGILLENFVKSDFPYFITVFLFVVVFLAIIYSLVNIPYRVPLMSAAIFMSILLTGQLDAFFNEHNKNFLPQKFFNEDKTTVYGKIKSIYLMKENSFNFIISTDSIETQKIKTATNVLLLCRMFEENKAKEDSLYNLLAYGNSIRITGVIKKGRGRRNPGEFDYNYYLKQQGISGIVNLYHAGDIKITNNNYNLSNYIFTIRKNINKQIIHLHQPETAALLRGLLLADRSLIDVEIKNYFINSGVIHVLAVSGLHVGYIVLIFLILFGRFNIYLKSVLTVLGIIFFMLITGMPTSVVRASIMAMVIIAVTLTNRSTNLFNSLALAALIILIFKPDELFSPGFQLSFSSVLAIAAIYPLISKKINLHNLKGIKKYSLLFVAVSFSAQLGTMPLVLYYFRKLSLTSLAANFIVIPAIGIVVALGIAAILINIVSPAVALFYAASNDMITKLLFMFISFAGGPSYSYLPARHFTQLDVIIFYLLIIFYFIAFNKFKNIAAKIMLTALVLINLLVFCSLDEKKYFKENQLNVMMIDVGQGDSFLIKFPNGKTALIDAGNATRYFDNGENVILPLLNYLEIDKIDYGFVSHIDLDHYAGFVSLIHNGVIKEIIKSPTDSVNGKDIRFTNFIKQSGVKEVSAGGKIIKIGNARIYILNKNGGRNLLGNTTNENSTILKVVYGNTSILFTGDAGRKAEKFYMAKYGGFLKSYVLKVSHHGSNTGTSDEFLSTVSPKICLISAGVKNRFGHPSLKVITELKNFGCTVYRTDSNGAAILISDGNTFKKCDWN